MQNENFPTEELKKFGIINEDMSFSKKLTEDDIRKFLNGYTIVADNDKNRATFQLVDDNTRLKVIFLERDKNLSQILKDSREKVQYSQIMDTAKLLNRPELSKKAFIYDPENGKVAEFDLVKNASEVTAIIADKMDTSELLRYKEELQKLKNYLMDQVDKYPEISKEIYSDINILSREIDTVNSISPDRRQQSKQENSEIDLNVNDHDLYEDAAKNREIEEETEEREKSRGFRR